LAGGARGIRKIFSPILLLQVCEPLSRPGLKAALGLRQIPQQMAPRVLTVLAS